MNQKIDALREQLQQLQARHERGEIDADALAASRAPIEREMVALIVDGGAPTAAAAPAAAATAEPVQRPSTGLVAGIVASVIALAAVGYGLTGSPQLAMSGPGQATDAGLAAGDDGGEQQAVPTEEQVRAMVAKLAERLQQQPNDQVGWTMLARAYTVMGQTDDAINAFRKALALAGDDAGLMADLADALAAKANGDLSGEPTRLVQRAIELEPDNLKALALAGSIAFDKRDFAAAVRHWAKVERSLPPDSPFLPQVHASINEARQLGGLPPADFSRSAATGGSPAAPDVAAASAISGTVSLAAGLKGSADPDDTVFIVARAADGPRLPLAVLRKQVRDLPLQFRLDDNMAMAPTAKISDHPQIVVLARISKSGDAMPQAGDLAGQSAPVAPGTGAIAIEINQKLDAAALR
ncbi:tetratricopeptide repeat protein [Piscinibacter sakaiensis]|uniref:c-type cytochrome biogenesis protein CcmI/CycH n=1 Tax=Piscinibacter sakaiensis TaxID=1547922 RepID=UPI003AAD85C7